MKYKIDLDFAVAAMVYHITQGALYGFYMMTTDQVQLDGGNFICHVIR